MAPVQYAKDQPAGFKNRIEKVAIVGAGGTMGRYTVAELRKTGRHTITALTRAGSNHTLPEGVAASVVVDYDDHDGLVAALRGQDFLMITLSVRAPPDTSNKLVAAAAAAGIKYVMPNVYGSNPLNAPMFDDMGFGPAYRTSMATMQAAGLQPIVLACGFWYEFSLGGGDSRYGFDLVHRKVTWLGDGNVPIYTSTWPQCGRAVAALLDLPVLPTDAADTRPTLSSFAAPNVAYITSFHVSQRDMYESIKRVTGTTDADWPAKHEDAQARWANASKALQAGGGVQLDGTTPLPAFEAFVQRMYSRIFFPGGDGVTPEQIVNKKLGLPEEDLDEWTRAAVRIATNNELATYGQ
ncbi:isoflavone reductase family protein [Niveomyces insectorum RCEF 264]|uniref:Isoflavone reductase family protein n=1 Tax=Niveomyces insectorum RCEF 264 TaxID=1081102 RepID=A0A167Y0G8_9HYPO|nr:isoflavone reductase family protein [Niveomyces insectorum RCEF 264]